MLDEAESVAARHRHFEFSWFPHTDRVLTKRNDIAAEGEGAPLSRWRATLDDHLLSNVVFEQLNRLATRRPSLAPRINQVSAHAPSRREFTDASYRVFCTRRDVRFVESEYAIPRASLAPVLRELDRWIESSGEHVAFPVEVRFAAIVAEHAGRPHWGKLHNLGAERLARVYPRFDDDRALRDRLDPQRVFTNDHLDRLLG